MSDYKDYEEFLKNVDEVELRRRIRRFRNLNFEGMEYSEIANEIDNVLTSNGTFMLIPDIYTYPTGVFFYRTRTLKDVQRLNETISKISDFWNPPVELMDKNMYGRLNKPQESLLYTAPIDALVAVDEIVPKLEKDNNLLLIAYQSIEKIKVNFIGGDFYSGKFGIHDEKAIRVGETYNDFFRVDFMRDVGKGTEYLYKISEIIAKQYFDLPPREIQDAWAYPSIKTKTKCNVCFRAEIAKDLLELQGAVIAKYDQQQVHCYKVIHGFDQTGRPIYHEIGSEIQKRLFPEIGPNPNGGKNP